MAGLLGNIRSEDLSFEYLKKNIASTYIDAVYKNDSAEANALSYVEDRISTTSLKTSFPPTFSLFNIVMSTE